MALGGVVRKFKVEVCGVSSRTGPYPNGPFPQSKLGACRVLLVPRGHSGPLGPTVSLSQVVRGSMAAARNSATFPPTFGILAACWQLNCVCFFAVSLVIYLSERPTGNG